MAYQLSTIVTKVQQRVNDLGYSTSEITNYINDTQNDVFNEYRLKFMRSYQDYTTVAGVSDITNGVGLPTDYVEAISLRDTTTGQTVDLPFIDEDNLEDLYPNYDETDNGQPLYAFFDGTTIRLYPAPADNYTLRLRYFKRPTLLSADADVPAIPSEFEELLVAGAAYRVLQVKGAYDEAGILENKYQELLQKLVDRYSRARASGVYIMRLNPHYTRRRYNQIDSYHRIP